MRKRVAVVTGLSAGKVEREDQPIIFRWKRHNFDRLTISGSFRKVNDASDLLPAQFSYKYSIMQHCLDQNEASLVTRYERENRNIVLGCN